MTTAIYASLSALLIVYLSLNVIKERGQNKILYGDGGNKDLQIARAAHSNATEYIPIALLLLFTLEYNRANIWVIHALGIALILGRSIHAYSLLSKNLPGRVLGMQITIFTIAGLAILNFFYIPYNLFKL
ncbi:MAPEG family protein [Pseudanabaena sp. PCC 6802]|uniref:MAPEG family protein n=1 Tax=Pseudanabaena sp. PCC 6802 TaxID=118173 RepID=UPI000346E4DC|nr:MAPEG family protein [Pseudanabaena sp. PCC 6802]